MNYPGESWQELSWKDQFTDFWNFCSNVTNLDAPAAITEVDHAMAQYTDGEPWMDLGNYAHYIKTAMLPECESGDFNSIDCFGTQNSE